MNEPGARRTVRSRAPLAASASARHWTTVSYVLPAVVRAAMRAARVLFAEKNAQCEQAVHAQLTSEA
jgi:hypothetical protein